MKKNMKLKGSLNSTRTYYPMNVNGDVVYRSLIGELDAKDDKTKPLELVGYSHLLTIIFSDLLTLANKIENDKDLKEFAGVCCDVSNILHQFIED